MAGEYTAEVVTDGLLKFFAQSANDIDLARPRERFEAARAGRAEAQRLLGGPLPLRPPGFCVGCPERPVFSAIKLLEREVGKVHISSDIGCHSLRHPGAVQPRQLDPGLRHVRLPPRGAVAPVMQKRTISVMGDGGFWHNGLFERRRLVDVQPRRPRAGHHAERLHLGDRRAVHPQHRRQPRATARPTSDIAATLEGDGRRNGCAPSGPTTSAPCSRPCARR